MEEKQWMKFSAGQNQAIWEQFGSRLCEDKHHVLKRAQLTEWVAEGYTQWLQTRRVKVKKAPCLCAGSVQLQTAHNFSDTDLVLFAPSTIRRTQFLHSFANFLQQRRKNHLNVVVDGVEILEHAFVPLVRFRANLIIFDCLFVSIPWRTFKDLVAQPNPLAYLEAIFLSPARRKRFIEQMDPKSFLCVNSLFTAFSLFQHVPEARRTEWKQLVGLTNFYVRRRNLCSNITGFPSTIAFVLMATKILKLFPQSNNALELFGLFFEIFGTWNWYEQAVELDREPGIGKKGSEDPMVVWLPAFPHALENPTPRVNTCKNVTQATLNVFMEEMRIGKAHMRNLQALKEDLCFSFRACLFADETCRRFAFLMQRRSFFQRYPFFIQLSFQNLRNEQGPLINYLKWQLKYLLRNLDSLIQCGEIYEHFFVLRPASDDTLSQQCIYLGIQFRSPYRFKDASPTVSSFGQMLVVNVCQQGMHVNSIKLSCLPKAHPVIDNHVKQEIFGIQRKALV